MTRINLVNPEELMDQHLLAEYRELPRIVSLVKKSVESKKINTIINKISKTYILGTGHVIFFYNKGRFLKKRYKSIVKELKRRNFNIKFNKLDITVFIENNLYYNDWKPTEQEIKISLDRINEKISMKPNFYHFSG